MEISSCRTPEELAQALDESKLGWQRCKIVRQAVSTAWDEAMIKKACGDASLLMALLDGETLSAGSPDGARVADILYGALLSHVRGEAKKSVVKGNDLSPHLIGVFFTLVDRGYPLEGEKLEKLRGAAMRNVYLLRFLLGLSPQYLSEEDLLAYWKRPNVGGGTLDDILSHSSSGPLLWRGATRDALEDLRKGKKDGKITPESQWARAVLDILADKVEVLRDPEVNEMLMQSGLEALRRRSLPWSPPETFANHWREMVESGNKHNLRSALLALDVASEEARSQLTSEDLKPLLLSQDAEVRLAAIARASQIGSGARAQEVSGRRR